MARLQLNDPDGNEVIIDANESALMTATLYDTSGDAINKAALRSLTLTIRNEADGSIINNREDTDIFDANIGTVADDGTLTLKLQPADNPIVGDNLEWHHITIKWTWSDLEAQTQTGIQEYEVRVRANVPVNTGGSNANGTLSNILTLQDVVDHLLDVADFADTPIDYKRAVRSAVWGYQQATQRHKWINYDTEYTAVFNAEFDDGTIDVASSGVVTLTGGVFPSWSELASIYVDDERAYRVASRDSDTQVTLDAWNGSTLTNYDYKLRQDRVIIPDDVREVFDVWHESEDWSIRIVDIKTFRDYDRPRIYSGSDPRVCTFRAVTINGVYKTEMRISPGTARDIELSCAYQRRPREANILVVSDGASCTGGSVTLAKQLPPGINATDCLIRVADVDDDNTYDYGLGFGASNKAIEEALVTAQPDRVTLTAPLSDFSNKRVYIISTLDVPPYLMNAIKLYGEAQMARIAHRDFQTSKAIEAYADQELRYAMEQDAPYDRRSTRPMLFIDRLESTPYIVEV